jgi:hypothetical protein
MAIAWGHDLNEALARVRGAARDRSGGEREMAVLLDFSAAPM